MTWYGNILMILHYHTSSVFYIFGHLNEFISLYRSVMLYLGWSIFYLVIRIFFWLKMTWYHWWEIYFWYAWIIGQQVIYSIQFFLQTPLIWDAKTCFCLKCHSFFFIIAIPQNTWWKPEDTLSFQVLKLKHLGGIHSWSQTCGRSEWNKTG